MSLMAASPHTLALLIDLCGDFWAPLTAAQQGSRGPCNRQSHTAISATERWEFARRAVKTRGTCVVECGRASSTFDREQDAGDERELEDHA